jgi:hypothetical protein
MFNPVRDSSEKEVKMIVMSRAESANQIAELQRCSQVHQTSDKARIIVQSVI